MTARKRRRAGLENTRRGLYKTQRAIGDYQALRRGRLPRRLGRRAVMRRVMRAISGR